MTRPRPTSTCLPVFRRINRCASAALALVAVLACESAHAGETAGAAAPNIVLIIADDLGWGDYGFMGHPQIQSPRIDALARESLVFTRGYVPSSLCCPSLASLITGLYPHQHRVTSNDPPRPPAIPVAGFHRSREFRTGRARMSAHLAAVPRLPALLASAGYHSLQTGKWWQGDFRQGGFTAGMTTGQRHGDAGLAIGRQTMQPIYDFIDESREAGRPFLVWYAPMLPHQPHDPPERWMRLYANLAPSPEVARYRAMISWFDETVGQLVDFLDERQLRRETVVVLLADNGWIQDPAVPRYAPRSKQSPYEGGVRTPIVVSWPGTVAASTSDRPVSSIDVAPTLLHLAGQPIPPEMPGLDLLDSQAVAARAAVFGECFTHDARDLDRPAANLRWRWVVAGRWKLIVPYPPNEPEGRVELYDLEADPAEEHNLAGTEPERVRALAEELDRWWNPDE